MTGQRSLAGQGGFTIIEMVVAAGLLVLVTGATFAIFNPAQGTFQVQPEVADMQQRMRVGFDVVQRDLVNAGAGLSTGALRGPLVSTLAPVLPYRLGSVNSDPLAGRFFRPDAITVLQVPGLAPQSSLSAAPASSAAPLQVNLEPGCLASDPACGFRTGMRAIVLDDTGWFDTLTLTGVDPASRLLAHADDALTKRYASGAQVAQVVMTTYYLDANERNGTFQLMRYDGHRTDLPVVDDVVGLAFEYFGEASPPRLLRPATDPEGPWNELRSAPARGWREQPGRRLGSGRELRVPGRGRRAPFASCRAGRRCHQRCRSRRPCSWTGRGVPTRRHRTATTPTCSASARSG